MSELESSLVSQQSVRDTLTQQAASLSADCAAHRLALERLLKAKASRDRQLAALLVERNRLAQLLARTRVDEKEEADRRRDGDEQSWQAVSERLSIGSARKSLSSVDGSVVMTEGEEENRSGRKRPSLKEAQTPGSGRPALSPLSHNSRQSQSQQRTTPASAAAPAALSPELLMARVSSLLAKTDEADGAAGAAAFSSPSLLWAEEAHYHRIAGERQRKQVALLEDKARELEKVSSSSQHRLHSACCPPLRCRLTQPLLCCAALLRPCRC